MPSSINRELLLLIFLLGLHSSIATELRGSVVNEAADLKHSNNNNNTEWYDHGRMLMPSQVCPYPDATNLSPVRSGQYGNEAGDCFYMYWDPSICNKDNRCPLYIYVDGTWNAQNIDDRDTTYMKEMAKRGYVAVTVDYDDGALTYWNQYDSCSSFTEKSRKIFDESLVGSVIYQLCQDTYNRFGHGRVVPVDCNQGVAVNGYSQGGHITALAKHYTNFITAGLFWAQGIRNNFCAMNWSACMGCVTMDVPCMANSQIALPKHKRRYINGEKDQMFGACESRWGRNYRENVLNNLRIVSGTYCPSNQNGCFDNNRNMAGYHIVPEGTHDFMNVAPGSYFMDSSNPWGLHMNFDWLAREGRRDSDW